MILTKKVRLILTDELSKLYQSAGVARWAYNYTLRMQEMNHRFGGKFISDNDLRKHITKMKKRKKYAWLNEVSNNVVKQAVKDACAAFKAFFNGQAKHPRFKTKRRTTPSFYNDCVKLKVKGNLVLLEKIGWVKTNEPLPMGCKYYNPRIKFDGKYWYLTVGVEVTPEKVELDNRSVGVDVGIKELAVTSDDVFYENINKTASVRKAEKRLKRLQRRASKKYKKGTPKSKNLLKLEGEIRKQHRRLANIRTNHVHQATAEIVKSKPSRIVMEMLNISGMMKNKHLAKAIANQKLYFFKQCLQYKCERYGIDFVEADKWYPSSKLCNNCGTLKKDLKLRDRVYHCTCGHHCDRDLNASYNLRDYQAV
ncbi:transposase probable is891/is1136/is1341 [Trichococcus palustris]|jgi:putative transposase|uniref:Transposase probable is891/is1136/is1341 n=1 Tax=Trichococcus palustris TaxID=140314 RepID=A0A143YXY0_9LACT|nr:RNA-guided endonuclease TnpB family protein [Trichococcus palustris]CZR01628.1 transposase probable is891/is1136/is1341 [Trichococcus palustris]SFL20247.1 putative transposase [Trichococcus palustris]